VNRADSAHAVLRSKMHVGNESFAVLLGDDLIDERDNVARTND